MPRHMPGAPSIHDWPDQQQCPLPSAIFPSVQAAEPDAASTHVTPFQIFPGPHVGTGTGMGTAVGVGTGTGTGTGVAVGVGLVVGVGAVVAVVLGVVDAVGLVLALVGGFTTGLSTQREVPPVVFSILPGGQMHLLVLGSGVPPGPQTKFSAAGATGTTAAAASATRTKASGRAARRVDIDMERLDE
jgi:hypothetical protein